MTDWRHVVTPNVHWCEAYCDRCHHQCRLTSSEAVFKHCGQQEPIPPSILESFRNFRRPEIDPVEAIRYAARTVDGKEWNGDVEYVKSDPSETIR